MFFSLTVDEETELQLLEEDHAEALFRLVDDCREHLDPWLPWVRSNTRLEDSEQFIRRARSNWGSERAVQTGIAWRGELCGTLSIRFDGSSGDIGYWLHPEYEGNGIVTRSCRTLVDYSFAHYPMRRCLVRVAPENERSRAVPQRLGFVHEGTLREAGSHPDGPTDLEVHALLRSEWEEGW